MTLSEEIEAYIAEKGKGSIYDALNVALFELGMARLELARIQRELAVMQNLVDNLVANGDIVLSDSTIPQLSDEEIDSMVRDETGPKQC